MRSASEGAGPIYPVPVTFDRGAADLGLRQRTAVAEGRLEWIDVIRGLAVLLIVFVHGLRALSRSGFDVPLWLEVSASAFEPFRVPLLVFVTGMLLDRSLSKARKTYASGKLRAIGWPFVIWTAVIALVSSGSLTADGLVHALRYAPSPMWYLQFLLLAYAVAWLTRRVDPLVLATLAVIGSTFAPSADRVDRMLLLFGLMMAGRWASRSMDRWIVIVRRPQIMAVTSLSATWLAVSSAAGEGIRYESAWVPWTLCSFGFIIGLSTYLPRTAILTRCVGFVGRNSLIYYVLHWPIFVGAFRYAASVDFDRPLVLFCAVGLGVLAVSTLAAHAARLHWLFALPFEFPSGSRLTPVRNHRSPT